MTVRPARYMLLFFGAAALSLIAGTAAWWMSSVLTCPPAPEGAFLAYCRDDHYGDFEHGAYLYALEPEAVAAATRASVIVVGDSRAQFAFSTETVRQYFDSRRIPYYLLGMGYASTSPFAYEMLRRHAVRPRLLIVNAEPFFTREMTAIPAAVLRGNVRTALDYRRKRWLTPVHRAVCDRMPRLCHPASGVIHRRIADGAWLWNGLLADGSLSMPFAERTIAPEEKEAAAPVAKTFVDDLQLNGRCVLVTAIPGTSADTRQVASAVSQAIDGAAIFPAVEGLASLDGDHLNAESAERWSEAFLREAEPRISECVGG